MDCERAVELLSARLDHELSADDAAGLEPHLRDCPACRAVADALGAYHIRSCATPSSRAARPPPPRREQVNARLPGVAARSRP